MAIVRRKIGEFEYEYESRKVQDLFENCEIIERVKHIVKIISAPGSLCDYKDNGELIEFIVALERSGKLDRVETKYLKWDDYGPALKPTTPVTKPYEPAITWKYEDGATDNLVLYNNEHDAKDGSNIGKKAFSRTRLSPKNISE